MLTEVKCIVLFFSYATKKFLIVFLCLATKSKFWLKLLCYDINKSGHWHYLNESAYWLLAVKLWIRKYVHVYLSRTMHGLLSTELPSHLSILKEIVCPIELSGAVSSDVMQRCYKTAVLVCHLHLQVTYCNITWYLTSYQLTRWQHV